MPRLDRRKRRRPRGGRLRIYRGCRFVSKAPNRAGDVVPLRVSPMTVPHVTWWQAEVQPVIDRDPNRADRGWNWPLFAPMTFAAGTAVHHRPAGYTVGIIDGDGSDGVFLPCALVLLVGRMRALQEHRKRSTFVWYLTTAPEAAIRKMKDWPRGRDDIPKRLGTIALDVAVTHSFNTKRRGLIGLRAADEGGAGLLAWYEKQGMQVLPAKRRLPEGFRRLVKPSDGRYCYFKTDSAVRFSRGLDYLR